MVVYGIYFLTYKKHTYSFSITIKTHLYWIGGGVVANVLHCDIVVSEFKLQLCYYIHFWINHLGKAPSPTPKLWVK